MRVHSLSHGFFFLSLLFAAGFCNADDNTFKVVGTGECVDCGEKNFKTSQAFHGLRVTIDCKLKNGDMKRVGSSELDNEGKFKVSLPRQVVQNGNKLKHECYAQLHSAAAIPCPAHNGLEASKIVFKDQPNTFGPIKSLQFSSALCTSKFFWPYPLPPIPWFKNFGHPWPLPPPVPVYEPPPVPVYEPPPVPVYEPPPVPIYEPPPVPFYHPRPPAYKPPKKPCPPIEPNPPPIPVYEPPPVPFYHPRPPAYKPPKKPCPPIEPNPPVYEPISPPVHVYEPPPVPFYEPLPPPIPVYEPPPVPVYHPRPPVHKPPKKPCPPIEPNPPVYKPLPPPIPFYPIPPIKKKPFPPSPKIPPKYFHHPKFGHYPPLPPTISHP